MKKETLNKIVDFVDNASIVAFYTGRIFGNFRRGYKGCYTPMFEDQEKQLKMKTYEAEMRQKDKTINVEAFKKSKASKVIGFN